MVIVTFVNKRYKWSSKSLTDYYYFRFLLLEVKEFNKKGDDILETHLTLGVKGHEVFTLGKNTSVENIGHWYSQSQHLIKYLIGQSGIINIIV